MLILPYKKYSKTAKALAKELGIKQIRDPTKAYQKNWKSVILNWGYSRPPEKAINKESVQASNKLNTLSLFKFFKVPHPEWTQNKEEALEWTEKHTVFGRSILNGREGKGIFILNDEPEKDAPLFVKYIPKKKEYRVHCFQKEKFYKYIIQEKLLKNGFKPAKIRNSNNGYVFGKPKDNPNDPNLDRLKELTTNALNALKLDFAAFDIIYNEKQDKYFVLEANTAPGLSPKRVAEYANIFREFYL